MSFLGRIFAGEEELGKKNDDHRRGRGDKYPPPWPVRNYAPWLRRRRVLYGLIACIALYLFFKNIPPPDHPPFPRPQYRPNARNQSPQHAFHVPERNEERPPRPEKPSDAENQYYDGPIRFYKLAASLHAISNLRGQSAINKNVLYAAASLRSASELIPMACEMGKWNRNNVHFALMGRDDLDMEEIKVLNGVDEECSVHWHGMRVLRVEKAIVDIVS